MDSRFSQNLMKKKMVVYRYDVTDSWVDGDLICTVYLCTFHR